MESFNNNKNKYLERLKEYKNYIDLIYQNEINKNITNSFARLLYNPKNERELKLANAYLNLISAEERLSYSMLAFKPVVLRNEFLKPYVEVLKIASEGEYEVDEEYAKTLYNQNTSKLSYATQTKFYITQFIIARELDGLLLFPCCGVYTRYIMQEFNLSDNVSDANKFLSLLHRALEKFKELECVEDRFTASSSFTNEDIDDFVAFSNTFTVLAQNYIANEENIFHLEDDSAKSL